VVQRSPVIPALRTDTKLPDLFEPRFSIPKESLKNAQFEKQSCSIVFGRPWSKHVLEQIEGSIHYSSKTRAREEVPSVGTNQSDTALDLLRNRASENQIDSPTGAMLKVH
jgi:hypothetical protein